MRDKILLRQLQALPLDAKVLMSQQRIREWYNHFEGKVVISFSGGKDSTVLAHLVHQMYPDVPMVFANTGLEYPEIQAFARKMGAEFVRPKMSFSEVISKYGYPIIGKEVAEAIHFARRIVLSGGGYANKRDSNESRFEDNEQTEADGVGGTTGERTSYCPPPEELHGRTGWRRANLTNTTPPPKWSRDSQIPKEEPPGTRRSKTEQQTSYPPNCEKQQAQKEGKKQSGEDRTSMGAEKASTNRTGEKATYGEVTKPG